MTDPIIIQYRFTVATINMIFAYITTAIFGVTGFPYIVRIEEVACLYINSLWCQSTHQNKCILWKY